MTLPHIYADFQNADALGRIRLNCVGTVRDLAEQGIELREGTALSLYCDDADDDGNRDHLVAVGTATYSADERCWVAVVDWNAVAHESQRGAISQGKPDEKSSRPVTFNGHDATSEQPPVDRR